MRIKNYLLVVLGAILFVGCSTTKNIPTQSASTIYKVGEVYNQNGLMGVVVNVDSTGKHGLLMSFEATTAQWLKNKDLKYSTNAFYDDDGEKNMKAIETCIKENNITWNDFPVFAWARSLGEGWYIPSRVEGRLALINLKQAFNVKDDIYKTAKKLRKMLKTYGADKMTYHMSHISRIAMIKGWFFNNDLLIKDLVTSTEKDGGATVWVTDNGEQTKRMRLMGGARQARAFHKF